MSVWSHVALRWTHALTGMYSYAHRPGHSPAHINVQHTHTHSPEWEIVSWVTLKINLKRVRSSASSVLFQSEALGSFLWLLYERLHPISLYFHLWKIWAIFIQCQSLSCKYLKCAETLISPPILYSCHHANDNNNKITTHIFSSLCFCLCFSLT